MAEPEKPDISSVLSHVQSLESEKKKLEEYVALQNQRLERLTQGKRDEMKKQLDTMIAEWLQGIDVTNEEVKKEFMTGMERIVKDTKDESGVWQVMCCASAAHRRNVTQLQQIQEEYNTLKTRVEGGTFRAEDARVQTKRPREGDEGGGAAPSLSGGGNVWDEFESFMKTGGGVTNFTPDPKTIKDLRQEWTPL
jgi:superfamily II RNA helicase